MIRSAALLLLLAPLTTVSASQTTAVTPADIANVNTLEEIVVTGDRTLSAARTAIVEAEDRFYARYNLLNTDDAFDIKCGIEMRGHFQSRVCTPRFVDEGTQYEASRLTSALNGSVMVASASNVASSNMAELRRRTLELVKKDPELLRALLERARLQQHYDALRKEKFKGRWIVWD